MQSLLWPEAPGLFTSNFGGAAQYGWQLSAHGGPLLAAPDDVGAAAWDKRARGGPRLGASPGPLHVAGPLGGRRQGPVADPARSAAGDECCPLVWPAGLDGTGLEAHAARRVAVAPPAHA